MSRREKSLEVDRQGDIEITFVGHGTLMMRWGEVIVHVDPVGSLADYAALPKAWLVAVTHQHGDHLDPKAIEEIRREETVVVVSAGCEGRIAGARVLANGDRTEAHGVRIAAVPAYNIRHTREGSMPFHPRGEGNGYVLDMGATRVYVAGDTEDIPEMRDLSGIHVAFLPMNLPYTMTPEMVAAAARMIRPKVLHPYHFGDTDTSRLVELLSDTAIDVRIRSMA